GQETESGGFAYDLRDEGGATRAEGLFESHLFGADGGAGRHEIDIVDDGQENEEPGDRAEEVNLGKVATFADLEFYIVVEIDRCEGLDEKGHGAAGVFPFLIADGGSRGWIDDLFAETIEPGLQIGLGSAGSELYII